MQKTISRWRIVLSAALFSALVLQLITAPAGMAGHDRIPEPNPPTIDRGTVDVPSVSAIPRQLAAATEWIYHKTSDNLHPDGHEQQMLWLMNRARSNPAQEGIWLATMDDPDVASARDHFSVNVSVLQSEFAGYAAKPPAAFDVRLYQAAKTHSDYMISIDSQTHDGQFARIDGAGFQYSQAAGIVFSYSDHAIYGHAAFNIDWGNGTDGTQDPPGHRYAIMSISGNYTNVGYAVVSETNPATSVGPQVITGNLCYPNTTYPDHYNRFIVGTVWEDTNGNDQYDPGEGLGGVRVLPDKGEFYAITADGGGYAIPILTAGTYTVDFSGGELSGNFAGSVVVGSDSVLLDLEYYGGSSTTPPPGGNSGNGGSSGGGGGGSGGCLITAAADGLGRDDDKGAFQLPGVLEACLAWLMIVGRSGLLRSPSSCGDCRFLILF